MDMKEVLLKNHSIHVKTRTTKHKTYPERFWVPDDKVFWDSEFKAYNPVSFTAPVVLDPATSWADPREVQSISGNFISHHGNIKLDEEGYPLNPIGRTGLKRRGVLGKWGANFAVDGLISTIDHETEKLKILVIKRSDTGEWAIPGGMVDPGENAILTRNRELSEELGVNESDLSHPVYEKEVYKGYVDDPRNTDNAWMETTVIHSHVLPEVADKMQLVAGDDAKDFQWVVVTDEVLNNFYASHGFFVLLAKEYFESFRE